MDTRRSAPAMSGPGDHPCHACTMISPSAPQADAEVGARRDPMLARRRPARPGPASVSVGIVRHDQEGPVGVVQRRHRHGPSRSPAPRTGAGSPRRSPPPTSSRRSRSAPRRRRTPTLVPARRHADHGLSLAAGGIQHVDRFLRRPVDGPAAAPGPGRGVSATAYAWPAPVENPSQPTSTRHQRAARLGRQQWVRNDEDGARALVVLTMSALSGAAARVPTEAARGPPAPGRRPVPAAAGRLHPLPAVGAPPHQRLRRRTRRRQASVTPSPPAVRAPRSPYTLDGHDGLIEVPSAGAQAARRSVSLATASVHRWVRRAHGPRGGAGAGVDRRTRLW